MVANPEGLLVADDDRQPARVRCPRCGYDLRGLVATWEDCCPLEGVCSECGLTLRWAEVLVPEKLAPRWCVEFARSRRDLPGACMATFVRSYRPWRFWTSIRMAYPVRGKRLAVYVLLLLAPFVIGYVVEQTAVAVAVRRQVALDLREHQKDAPQILGDLQLRQQSESWQQLSPSDREFLLMQTLLLEEEIQSPTVLRHSYVAAILEAVFSPFGKSSSGELDGLGSASVYSYPAPCRLHRRLERSITGMCGDTLPWFIHQMPYFGWWLLVYALLPVCFVALPVSRRRARVRWRHLARITVYGVHIPVTVAFAMVICFALALAWPSSADVLLRIGSLFVLVIMLPWILIWWVAAIDRHLRMEHAAAVTTAVMLMALLASTLIVYLLNDELVFVPLSWVFSGL